MPVPNGDSQFTGRVQVIDEDKKFTKELNSYVDRWGLMNAGFDYNVVAVFGSQSTGKSTLLNRLFGTTFDVMDETQRRQTTKGIWMCRGKGANIMVMDVEGTDGRERGEDQDFERKSALFSMASSEILLVNLWEQQVGLYQGANMGLLKTVFEVNLNLFGKNTSSRTLLLFVIRDHIGVTPLANLQATLTADMNKIWDSLSKPQGLEDAKLSDYFDLDFNTLPHKILLPEKFEQEVVQLRGRFTEPSRPDFVFKPAYHKRIPADGVSHYMEGIWEQVQSNKDLDLPTQQELLAQFRCDEIAAGALEEFNTQAKGFKKPVESGKVVSELGKLMSGWKKTALARFDSAASRYHQGVYSRKRQDLIVQLNSTLSPLFFGQLKNLHKSVLTTFKNDVVTAVRAGGDYDFGAIVSDGSKKAISTFEEGAKESMGLLAEGGEKIDPDWTYEDELELLQQEIAQVADQCRKDETKKMINAIERTFKKNIAEPIEVKLSTPSPDMWDGVLTEFRDNLSTAESSYLTKAQSFNCTPEENDLSIFVLRKRAWVALRAKIDEQTADAVLLTKLRTQFEDRFRYDENKIPRVWKPEDDIDGAFKKARDQTLALIPIYAQINPLDSSLAYTLPPPPTSASLASSDDLGEEYDFNSTLQVLSETKKMDLSTRFRRDADAYYVEAKRSIVSSVAQIPVWMYGLLVFLGWNEAMTVLFNPLYFTMLIVGVAGAYIIFQLGLAGPLFQVTKQVGNEVKRQAVLKLKEQFAEPQAMPAMSRQSTSQSIGSSKTPNLSRKSTTYDDELEKKTL